MKNPARILIVGHYEPDRQFSMWHYADLLEQLFGEAGWEVDRIRPEPGERPSWMRRLVGAKWAGNWDKWGAFPLALRRHAATWVARAPERSLVVLPDHSHSPYLGSLAGHLAIGACHDLMAVRGALGELPRHRPRWSGRQLQRRILANLARLPFAVAVSESTRRDLERLVPELQDRVRIVRSALNAPYGPLDKPEAASRLVRWPDLAGGRRFFLHVGNDSWYKNRDGLLEAYGRLQALWSGPGGCPDLVLAGAPLSERQAERVAAVPWGPAVRALGPVTASELEGLYNRAVALAYPSFEEGFGWPPLEAQACGCPVVASRGGALLEVLEESADAVAPEDSTGLAQILCELAVKPERAEYWRRSGFENVKRFSREAMGAGWLAAAEAALAAGRVR